MSLNTSYGLQSSNRVYSFSYLKELSIVKYIYPSSLVFVCSGKPKYTDILNYDSTKLSSCCHLRNMYPRSMSSVLKNILTVILEEKLKISYLAEGSVRFLVPRPFRMIEPSSYGDEKSEFSLKCLCSTSTVHVQLTRPIAEVIWSRSDSLPTLVSPRDQGLYHWRKILNQSGRVQVFDCTGLTKSGNSCFHARRVLHGLSAFIVHKSNYCQKTKKTTRLEL